MKITMYELLGMIKDDKAPKKIKYREMIYHICYEYGDYESDVEEYRFADTKEHYYLFESIDMLKCLNDEVEILEEEPKVQVELTEKEYLEYLDKINEYMESVRNYTPKPSFLKLEEEKKIPEKLDHLIGYDIQQFDDLKEYVEIVTNDLFGKVNKIIDTLNQLSDYLKSKGE